MKMRVLLITTFLVVCSIALQAQSYKINWNEADSVKATNEKTVKRTGYLINNTFSTKKILFKYSLAGVAANHDASLCFGENCFILFPGEDIPSERPVQKLQELGQLYLVADVTPNKTDGTSTVWFELFDSSNVEDKLAFTTTFVVGPLSSIQEPASSELSLYPLPASNVVTLRGTLTQNVRGIDLYSAQGNIVRSFSELRSEERSLDISGLSAGSYHLLLTLHNGSVVRLPLSIIH